MHENFDIVIAGGGLVGASLACALEGGGWRVAQVEATPGGGHGSPAFDERNLALARASVHALRSLGVWGHLDAAPTPIRHVHVSSRGDFGAVRLDAAEYRLEDFGQVVVARELGAALERRLLELRGLTRLRPARVAAVGSDHEQGLLLQVETGEGPRTLAARLLVAADGTRSSVRAACGIGASEHDYLQTLFVATVGLERAHGECAYERFTPEGPVAMLPLSGKRMGSVCTVPAARAEAVAALDEDGYRALLQARFGWRLGRLGRIGRRSAYPLTLLRAQRLHGRRVVVVGNAAQTLHPIGAQGFNLGLRDALVLAEALEAHGAAAGDPGAQDLLARYSGRRQQDRERTIAFSDGLARLFGNHFAPLRAMRSVAMAALEHVPGLSAGLVAGATGFRGEVPRLALERVR